jgi:hypothetical protein
MLIDGRSHCLSSLFFALHTEKKSRIKNEDAEDDDDDEEEEAKKKKRETKKEKEKTATIFSSLARCLSVLAHIGTHSHFRSSTGIDER